MPLHRVRQPVIANGFPMRLVSMPASAGFPSPAGDDLEDAIDPMAWVVRHRTPDGDKAARPRHPHRSGVARHAA